MAHIEFRAIPLMMENHMGEKLKNKLSTSSTPTLGTLLHEKCNVSMRPQIVFFAALQLRCKTIEVLALQGKCCGARHCKGSAEQGHFAIEYSRTTLRLALWGYVPWALCGWALQGYSAVGHCRKTWRLGTAGIFGGFCTAGILGA